MRRFQSTICSTNYLNQWVSEERSQRLEKMANSMARSCYTAHKQSHDMSVASERLDGDPAWLKKQFCNPLTFSFACPQSRTW